VPSPNSLAGSPLLSTDLSLRSLFVRPCVVLQRLLTSTFYSDVDFVAGRKIMKLDCDNVDEIEKLTKEG